MKYATCVCSDPLATIRSEQTNPLVEIRGQNKETYVKHDPPVVGMISRPWGFACLTWGTISPAKNNQKRSQKI